MGGFIQNMESRYESLKVGYNPIIDNWFMMSSPLPVFSLLFLYFYVIYSLGPKIMKDRKALTLRKTLVIYNAYQVLYSMFICFYVVYLQNSFNIFFSSGCRAKKNFNAEVAMWNGAWYFFVSKVIELLDTVFFVLRKKQSQITFLHVYHHSCTLLSVWLYTKYLPGEQGMIIGFLNSFTHVVMYSYYLLAALGPEFKKYLWWKRYMTWVQLIQFCLIITYIIYSVVIGCKFPMSLNYFFVLSCAIYIYLFGKFYRANYVPNKKLKMTINQNSSKLLNDAELNNNNYDLKINNKSVEVNGNFLQHRKATE